MFHVNKKSEYALLALGYMGQKGTPAFVSNAREIAEAQKIPYALLAKILQTLAFHGYVKVVHGTKGGYLLAKKPFEVTVAEIIAIFEGPIAIADCFQNGHELCTQMSDCFMRDPFEVINHKIHDLLSKITLVDLMQHKNLAFPEIPALPKIAKEIS